MPLIQNYVKISDVYSDFESLLSIRGFLNFSYSITFYTEYRTVILNWEIKIERMRTYKKITILKWPQGHTKLLMIRNLGHIIPLVRNCVSLSFIKCSLHRKICEIKITYNNLQNKILYFTLAYVPPFSRMSHCRKLINLNLFVNYGSYWANTDQHQNCSTLSITQNSSIIFEDKTCGWKAEGRLHDLSHVCSAKNVYNRQKQDMQ
jgi:hypothetical protein